LHRRLGAVSLFVASLFGLVLLLTPTLARAAQPHRGGEADLVLPDLSSVQVLGMSGSSLLMLGMIVAALGLVFGVVTLFQVKNLPVLKAMSDVSQIIWETCKTYLFTQGKFITMLEVLIGAIIVLYFGVLQQMPVVKVAMILGFSLIGIAGSYGVAWFGIRINTYANSRTAFASLRGRPYDVYAIPLKAGMSIGMLLISSMPMLMPALSGMA